MPTGTPEKYGADSKGNPPAGVYEEFRGASVLLPLLPEEQYRPRVLTCGGRKAYTIDLSNYMPASKTNPPVQWRETGPRQLHGSPERRNLNAVLLPTGQVFVCGGVEGKYIQDVFVQHNVDAVMNAELYDPIDDSWEVLERAQVVRNYHSVALLMPDGRVWTAGSNDNCEEGHNELRIEVYEPWYFGRPDRPEITEPSYARCRPAP